MTRIARPFALSLLTAAVVIALPDSALAQTTAPPDPYSSRAAWIVAARACENVALGVRKAVKAR